MSAYLSFTSRPLSRTLDIKPLLPAIQFIIHKPMGCAMSTGRSDVDADVRDAQREREKADKRERRREQQQKMMPYIIQQQSSSIPLK